MKADNLPMSADEYLDKNYSAEYQDERSYSRQDVISFGNDFLSHHINVLAERKYSEEDVKIILNKLLEIDCSYFSEEGDKFIIFNGEKYTLDEWFEQFKK